MLLSISGYLIIPLEVICCKMFFETFCRSKKKMFSQILFWSILCVLIYIPALLLGNLFIMKQMTMIGIIAVATKLYWKMTYKKSVMLAVMFQSLVLVVDYVTIVMNRSLLDRNICQNQTIQAFWILFTKMVLFLLVIVMKRIMGQNQMDILEDASWLKFLFFPIFTICIIMTLISKPELMINEAQKQIFWIFAFGLVGMNVMLFYLLQDVAKREHELFERRIFEREVNHKFALYESVVEATKRQQALSHEYQNQLVCIRSLLYTEQYIKLEEYMEQITGVLRKELDCIDTNNVIVNAILNEKYFQAVEQDIVMVYQMNDLKDLVIADQDIVLLLSNLLNNAIEACRKCDTKKVIKVKLLQEDDNVVLSVKNTYDGNVITSDGSYITTKKNKENHGIGIKNVVHVIEKYEGVYSITHDEIYFSFSCFIPV